MRYPSFVGVIDDPEPDPADTAGAKASESGESASLDAKRIGLVQVQLVEMHWIRQPLLNTFSLRRSRNLLGIQRTHPGPGPNRDNFGRARPNVARCQAKINEPEAKPTPAVRSLRHFMLRCPIYRYEHLRRRTPPSATADSRATFVRTGSRSRANCPNKSLRPHRPERHPTRTEQTSWRLHRHADRRLHVGPPRSKTKCLTRALPPTDNVETSPSALMIAQVCNAHAPAEATHFVTHGGHTRNPEPRR